MHWFGTLRGLAFWLALFLLLSAPGCSSPAQQKPDHPFQGDQLQAPFQEAADPNGNVSAEQNGIPKPESRLPFGESQGLPAGMLVTVLLRDPVSANSPGAGGTFAAVIDEPVVVEGSTLLPRGARVMGRVEAAHASRFKRNRGYVQLTLAFIDIGGQEIPIQTSSLFVNGNSSQPEGASGESSPQIIRVEGGRRLTFRLTEPVLLASQTTVPAH